MHQRFRIDALTFDIGGTLIAPHPSVGHVYAEVAARHGVTNLSPERLNRQFAAAWRARTDFNHTREDWAALVDDTFAGLVRPPPSQSFFPVIYERFADAAAWKIYDDVLPTLDALASKGIPMAVVSNWDERLRPLLEELRLESYFEAIVVSCEVAFPKPSPVIFQHATQKLGLPPGSILHIGDSWSEDYEGAKAAGLQALLLDRSRHFAGDEHLRSLRELDFRLSGVESP
jgi:putative hydrolase of the HAD superfamily